MPKLIPDPGTVLVLVPRGGQVFGDGSRGLKSGLGSSVRDESMEGFRRKIVAMSSLALLE